MADFAVALSSVMQSYLMWTSFWRLGAAPTIAQEISSGKSAECRKGHGNKTSSIDDQLA